MSHWTNGDDNRQRSRKPGGSKFRNRSLLETESQRDHENERRSGSTGNFKPSIFNSKRINIKRSAPNEEGYGNVEPSTSKRRKCNEKSFKMGFRYVENLLKNEDLEEVVIILNNDRTSFKDLMNARDLTNDFIVILIKLVSKICASDFQQSKIHILQMVLCSTFIETLGKFISGIAMQGQKEKNSNKFFWNNIDEFWHNVINICKSAHNLIPLTSSEKTVNVLKGMKLYLPVIEESHSIQVSNEIKREIENLFQVVEKTTEKQERIKEQKEFTHEVELEPPEDFREISIYPTTRELVTKDAPFLRPNIIQGPYKDVNHYLDIQYRLLREDFVSPLKRGIFNYLKNSKEKLQDVKIYNPIRFLNIEIMSDQTCYRIQYSFRKKNKKYNYVNSKTFMYGSLLCFTCDNFKTILFGRVARRDFEDLEKQQLVVDFHEDIKLPTNLLERDYLMVESKVYFEPYYHVLNVLKLMDITQFPMEKYLIRAETDSNPPEYLLKPSPVIYRIGDESFSPLNWENRKFSDLNDAQLDAYKSALTEKFVIIQGPPGTGKTYLGLKVARTLLRNKDAWYTNTPMLVICYTNHALDQFLEGLLKVTVNLVRVGNQSKNSELNKYNIRNQKPKFTDTVFNLHEIKGYRKNIHWINETLKQIEANEGILDFSVFHEVVENFYNTWFSSHTSLDILNWLFDYSFQQNQWTRRPYNKVQVNDCTENIEDKINEQEWEIDEIIHDIKITPTNFIVIKNSLRSLMRTLENKLSCLRPNLNYRDAIEADMIRVDLDRVDRDYNLLKQRLAEASNGEYKNLPTDVNLENPYRMSQKSRWHLYFYWLQLYKKKLIHNKNIISQQFCKQYKVYNEMREIENVQIMKKSLVVGMTTTSAARLRSSICALKSPIVIVEEAAEVLESHIVCSLSKSCQHLILIGDHQQLKPSTSDFKIEKKYHLGVSLFERMINNNMKCHQLKVQHRMRPEISCLIHPSIYSVLKDHPSVLYRPPIRGVENSVYFIDHQEPEELCEDSSKKNTHEATFLLEFAKYLILNGYEPEEITIVVTYLGQMYEMQRLRKQHSNLLKEVRITVLDNYQGEENNIILLSLVRSNNENKIGFLKIENRVCVALSRARNGLYIMGNMAHLCKNSVIWRKVDESLEKQKAIGPYLTLRCQIHPDKVTRVKTAEDFLDIVEGGCTNQCAADLICGHQCTRICHVLDREHREFKCIKECNRILCGRKDHKCKKKCYQGCGPCYYKIEKSLDCGHSSVMKCFIDTKIYKCLVNIKSTLPCGHEAEKPCYKDLESFQCKYPCKIRVEPCGHACTRRCHINSDPDHLQYQCKKPCTKPRINCSLPDGKKHMCSKKCCEECQECTEMVEKVGICTHAYEVPCNMNVDEKKCEEPCKLNLPCGHKCSNKCHKPCGPCNVMVEKTVPQCGHTVKIQCCEEPDRKVCTGKCPNVLPCGHKCDNLCREDCTIFCQVIVDCSIQAPCEHTIKQIVCAEKDSTDPKTLLKYCTEKCNATLKCGHICSGTCGKCLQGRIHQRCGENCNNILICNHECPIPCNQACKPCNKKCRNKCIHTKCSKNCGDPCTTCREPCNRRCKHQKCRNWCGELCSIPPCYRDCNKLLQCRHSCIGFCGDPCPKLCRICNREELTEIFFGTEDEHNARFVMLTDCKHVFESKGLEEWLRSNDSEIIVSSCPRCKTPVTSTERYSDIIKKNMKDIISVKRKTNGSYMENNMRRAEMQEVLNTLKQKLRFLSNCLIFTDTLKTIESSLMDRKKKDNLVVRQILNKPALEGINCKIQIVESIIDIFNREQYCLPGTHNLATAQLEVIMEILKRSEYHITQQEIEDAMLEIDRLLRIVQYEKIKMHCNFNNLKNNNDLINRTKVVENLLLSFERYGKKTDEILQTELAGISKLISSNLNITVTEKKEIVAALGLTKGHWFKCPNGHLYVITECGGAMQTSKCNECGVPIGGRNHALLPGQTHASEMDGSTFPAWSEAANMRNYGRQF